MRTFLENMLSNSRRGGDVFSFAFMIVIFITVALVSPLFLKAGNLSNLLSQIAPLYPVSVGQMLVILTGQLDLSVGPVISLTTAIVSSSLHPAVSVALALLVGGFIGMLNGLGVAKLRIHPIIMTLSMQITLQGVCYYLRPNPGGTVGAALRSLNSGSLLGIPAPFLVIAGVTLIAYLILYESRYGVHIFAVGGGIENAEMNGINTTWVIVKTFVLCSMFSVISGIVIAARIGSGFAVIGDPFTLDSIIAVALGGTQLVGGIGSLLGTFCGNIILATLANGMNLANLSAYFQMFVKGLLLMVIISFQRRKKFGL